MISDDSLLGTGFDANDLDKLIADVTDTPNDKKETKLRAVSILLLVD